MKNENKTAYDYFGWYIKRILIAACIMLVISVVGYVAATNAAKIESNTTSSVETVSGSSDSLDSLDSIESVENSDNIESSDTSDSSDNGQVFKIAIRLSLIIIGVTLAVFTLGSFISKL
jgi:hypothetical protein